MQQLPMRNKKPKSVCFTACKAVPGGGSEYTERFCLGNYLHFTSSQKSCIYNHEYNFFNVFISTCQLLFYFCICPSGSFRQIILNAGTRIGTRILHVSQWEIHNCQRCSLQVCSDAAPVPTACCQQALPSSKAKVAHWVKCYSWHSFHYRIVIHIQSKGHLRIGGFTRNFQERDIVFILYWYLNTNQT